MYWNINEVMSYAALFNFILGARGVGKTFGCKDWVIKRFLNYGEQFIYLRRYKTEFKKIGQFFADIEDKYSDHELKTTNAKEFYIDGKLAGCTLALSTAKTEKSVAFPKVKWIIFDEFILDKGNYHYLPDEVTNFLECYSTIARDRDVVVFFISNAITVTNPYFIYFDITLPYGKDIAVKNDILIQYIHNEEYAEHMNQTRFGKIIQGTEYGNYAINNEFYRDTKMFIGKKPKSARYLFTFVYGGEKFGVWYDYNSGYYVSKDIDPFCKLVYTFSMDDHKINYVLVKGKPPVLIKSFVDAYKNGLVQFENINIKNITSQIIKLYI